MGKADAGVIRIRNDTSTSGIGKQYLFAENVAGASDEWDGYPPDAVYSDPINNPSLTIYTKVPGSPTGFLSTDARAVATAGWDFDLGVKATVVDATNFLKVYISDLTNLEGRVLTAWALSNPSAKHPITNELNATTIITLPNLTARDAEYAHWRLEIIPEPSALLLFAAIGGSLLRLKTRREQPKDS